MPSIVSRAQWGARYARGFAPAPLPAQEVWLHHSVTAAPPVNATPEQDAAAVRVLEDIGQDRFGGGISYTFAITPSGRIHEGHGVDRRGAHTGGRNTIARAICLIGNYETATPSPAQLAAVAWLLAHGQASGWWKAARLNGGHRDAPGASTACPGRNAHAAIAAINGVAGATSPIAPAPGPDTRDEVDMATKDELRQLMVDVVRAEVPPAVWNAAMPDYYQQVEKDQPVPTLPAFAAIGHTAANAARGRDYAAAAREATAALHSAVAHLSVQVADAVNARAAAGVGVGGPAITQDDVRELIRAALSDLGPLYLAVRPGA